MKRFVLIVPLLLLISCGGGKALKYFTPEDQYRNAMKAFERGDYGEALDGFKKLMYSFHTGPYTDDAQFYIGECYLKMKDYDEAISEFRFFLSTFTGSDLIPNAQVELARAYIEKTKDPTKDVQDLHEAIRILRDFLSKYEKHPLRNEARKLLSIAKDKLAKRMLIASRVYHLLGKYESEELYLRLIINEYPGTETYWEAKLNLGKLLFKVGKTEEGRKILIELSTSESVPLKIRSEARVFLAQSGIS